MYIYNSIDSRIPSQILPKQSKQYFIDRSNSCPILNVKRKSLLEDLEFEFKNIRCDFDSDTKRGYDDAIIEIYNINFEQGKSEFRNWLKENGLEESDRLRITYIHKPK